jgi:bifunctional non-homologous end joining protein LigD
MIDGELVACDGDGLPNFYRLHFHRHDHGLGVWAFDLLHHNGRDLRELPLIERKARLEKLILVANANWLHYSECFDGGLELLKAADYMRLEGIVSKRRDAPYPQASSAVGLRSSARPGAQRTKSVGAYLGVADSAPRWRPPTAFAVTSGATFGELLRTPMQLLPL